MTEKDPMQSGPSWHWGILAVLFGVGGVQRMIDPPVGGLGYVFALFMLGIAASATHKACTQFQRRRARREPNPHIGRIT